MADNSAAPVRTCVGCKSKAAQSDLIRLALDGDAVVCDHARRLPGRGAYLHPDRRCWEAAQRRQVWPRVFRVKRALDISPAAEWFAAV